MTFAARKGFEASTLRYWASRLRRAERERELLGFRCCAEPDGKATDPRTPKQRADGWKIDRVERYAQFTTDEMREKLRLKAEGKCTCKETDILCKTMCGTLLGPETKDADLFAPRP